MTLLDIYIFEHWNLLEVRAKIIHSKHLYYFVEYFLKQN